MKCLVTGGAGFIGSHIVEALVERKAQVCVLDNFFSGNKKNLENVKEAIEIIEGDILDRKVVERVMKNVDTVFHQAALRSVPASFEDPSDYNNINIQGTLVLLEEAHRNRVKKFIYASSSSVYGENPSLPKKESDLTLPVSPYAVSKLAAEQYCQIFTKTYKLPTVSLRYFNVFGPRQPVNDGYSPVVPRFISCFLQNESPPVYGDGTQSRDFTYIENVVEANLLAMDKEHVTGVFNVGMGENHTLLDIIDLLNSFLKKKMKPSFLPPQKGDVKHTLASIELIQEKLGYRSLLSFKEGLKRTLEFFQKL